MRLLVNATAYGDPPGGAGLRARYLFAAMEGVDVVWLAAEDTPRDLAPPGAEVRVLPVRAARPWSRARSLRLPTDGDVLLTDHYPVARRIPTVVTFHDTGRHFLRRALLRRVARRACASVAVSAAVRDALSIDAAVVPNGFAPPSRVSAPPSGERYLLFSDPALPHKDAATARAVARALGLPLREVGRGAAWLPRDEVLGLMAGAAAVLCPSRDEGFGMTPLDAMGAGAPVVVSDLPAHREVCGDGAWYAPPGDVAAFVAAARAALSRNPARLAAARARAAALTWSAAAARLREIVYGAAPK